VTQYIGREIAAAGYNLETVDGERGIEWNLENRPGDGVAFYGRMYGLLPLSNTLLAGKERAAAARAIRKAAPQLLISRGGRAEFFHADNMVVEVLVGPMFHLLTDMEMGSMRKLESRIEENALKLSTRLENEGYGILEGSNPVRFTGGTAHWARTRSYRAGSYRTEIRIVEDKSFDPYVFLNHNFVKGMAEGRNVTYCMEARISFLDGEGKKVREIGRGVSGWTADARAGLPLSRAAAAEAFAFAREAAIGEIRGLAPLK
jgi:hypothetical protein